MDEDTEPLSSDFEALEELIAKNHSLLRTLGVSHPRLEDIVRIANSMKFRGVKLTGAGGGGFAYIFIPPTTSSYMVDKLISLIEKRGFERPRLTSIGVSGVQIKEHNDNMQTSECFFR
ncbi:E2.7.1.36 [Lepeophtheirus salmonis]|uniref:E2.7.1.36 n=1 Tax=Lepeophtheirus salmonis TaxID=72036 RepID=A0A7R8H6E1_LEPSM|nr:E2.7.1.36 [Lepeophtheirus salmonis]CAF2897915.1 E2.7.1.36 [Lepeophtheirus salmonis]